MKPRVLARLRTTWTLLVWAAVGVGSYVVGVQSAVGQQAEASVLDAAEPNFTTNPPAPLNLVSIPAVAVALLLVGLLALALHGIRRALMVTVVPALAIVASQLLKQQLLSRPQLFEFDAANTFPSGHMTVFAVVVAALILAVPVSLRAIIALVGAALLGAVGWQLLAYGWHRPSDLLGALALGVVAFALADIVDPGDGDAAPKLQLTISLLLIMSGLLLIVGALGAAWFAAAQSDTALMLLAGQLGVIGTSALAARSLLRLAKNRD